MARAPWFVARGPRALVLGPRALVPAELAELAELAEPRRPPGVCMYMQTGPAAPWCLHLHANRPPAAALVAACRWPPPWWPRAGGRVPVAACRCRVPVPRAGAGGRPPPTPGPKKWPPAQAAPALARFHTLGFT
jgi:hypothetical protein